MHGTVDVLIPFPLQIRGAPPFLLVKSASFKGVVFLVGSDLEEGIEAGKDTQASGHDFELELLVF